MARDGSKTVLATEPSCHMTPTRDLSSNGSFFSNLDISYQVKSLEQISDNAKTLSITAPYVANFRTSIVQGIVSTNYDVNVTEGNLSSSFGIRLAVKPTESTTVTLSISGDSDLCWEFPNFDF